MYGWSINIAPNAVLARHARATPHGILAGTLVATERGWQVIDDLRAGDRIWTFDHGMQPIVTITPQVLWGDPSDSDPVAYRVPAGALGNTQDMTLLAEAGFLLECENASDAIGDPFAVIPVAALDGVCGIRKIETPASKLLYTLSFATEVAFYIDSGLIVHCPVTAASRTDNAPRYDVKSLKQAKALLTDLDLAELALREPDEDFPGEMASDRVA